MCPVRQTGHGFSSAFLSPTLASVLRGGAEGAPSSALEYQDFRDWPPYLKVALASVECALWFRSDNESLVIHEERAE
jgi:hypothetical protein